MQTSGGSSAATQVSPTSNGAFLGNLPGVLNNANASISCVVKIPNYANTTFHKGFTNEFAEQDSATPTQRIGVVGAFWKSTSAITQIDITTAGTNFLNGCVFTMYEF